MIRRQQPHAAVAASATLASMLKHILSVQPHEIAALRWSFAYFFCLLCSHHILRPVRDKMGMIRVHTRIHEPRRI